ncbi:hypothetical protein ACIO93_11205 [Streptomyces sp. NPDC087903]|uniref:hypothetical protein n=1 Tax=Streptomyces sp. NPDC087903 TaxID=3365819 RepID=UPI003816AEAE
MVVVRGELATRHAVMALSTKARHLAVPNLFIAGALATALVALGLIGTLPLPVGLADHQGRTLIVGLNGPRLLGEHAWTSALGKDIA